MSLDELYKKKGELQHKKDMLIINLKHVNEQLEMLFNKINEELNKGK